MRDVEVGVVRVGNIEILPSVEHTFILRGVDVTKLTKSQTKLVALYEAVKARLNYHQLYDGKFLEGTGDTFEYVDGYMRGLIDGMGLKLTEKDSYYAIHNNSTLILICQKPGVPDSEFDPVDNVKDLNKI